MTDKHNEHLSALLDGEDVNHSLLDRMLKDDEQKSTLQRYQLASSIIRNDVQPGMAIDISAAVAAQVAAEPAHRKAVAATAKAGWWKPAANDAWWRPAASFAVAASVALVTVIGVTNYQLEPGNDIPQSGSSPVFETAPFDGMANPVSFNATEAPALPSSGSDQRRQIQSFFLDHQQQTQLSQQEQEEAEDAASQDLIPDNNGR
ncbi:sigma-E factor negative regulatory protein [Aliidiomarina soli]|uniref:Anti-sigma-E factor RseA n=1 Tax=Aliidiomarina soli TaxID=1928574 RepID=A0A432WLN8_9GAMM|nr:RseA family anti-sigma factor [Aliidiomarina soli]RUO34732.1 hypothetical protein CWE14_01665 [Aliidiomarina soli]